MPPVPGTGKRCVLSIEVKLKILKEIDENRRSKTEIAKAHNIPKSSLSTIIKNREKILKADTKGLAPDRSRTTEAKYPKLEKALLDWLKVIRQKNVPVDGNILKTKADEFALRMNIEDFKASGGWMQRFKLRHGLSFKKLCGESASVDLNVTTNWQAGKLKRLLRDYDPKDIFNADETALFFKVLPDRALVFKDEICSGGKQAKQRITLMMAANMNGTERLPLLAIGKSKTPRCFKGIKTLPTKYAYNTKAWMTGTIFKEWVRELDRKMAHRGRKILLIVDNCTAHEEIPDLESIRIEFFPPNTTSILQPMDQGIIQAFKKHYRKMLLRRIVFSIDHGQDFTIDLLGALHLAATSWNHLSEDTIANCFRHAGFRSEAADAGTGDVNVAPPSPDPADRAREDADILFEKVKDRFALGSTLNFQEYANIDSNVQCSEELSEEAIIQQAIRNTEVSDDSVSETEIETEADEPKPTSKEASEAAVTLRRYFQKEKQSENFLRMITEIENGVLKSSESFRQTSITGFFSKK